MHLAGKMAETLGKRLKASSSELSENLISNKNNLMAAGFLHDIAHGPFSHTVDFVMEEITGKNHQELARSIIEDKIDDSIEDSGDVNKKKVVQIIEGRHHLPFTHQIIDGPLDVDKLDYLLRDAHHVGLKYSFDLDQFLRTYTIVGDHSDIRKCDLGLEDSQEAIATAELFISIWKSMYEIVYYKQNSRIAEKMLEKAILIKRDEEQIRSSFTNVEAFLELEDDKLLAMLEKETGRTGELVKSIRREKLQNMISEQVLDATTFEIDTGFLNALGKKADKVADRLSLLLNEEFGQKDYALIVDIIRSKSPNEINIENLKSKKEEDGHLSNRSPLVNAIKPINRIKVYSDPSFGKKNTDKVQVALKRMIENKSDELIA
jgi:HD superfamily phosphohydrolase